MRSFNYTFSRLSKISPWSELIINNIHVRYILDLQYYKRSFRILDRDHHYTFKIKILKSEEFTTVAPVFTNKGVGFTVVNNVSLTSVITRRYRTEKELREELDKIQKLRNLYVKYVNERENHFLKKNYSSTD